MIIAHPTPVLSVSESLPTTAYIKMIDVWLIFNLLKPFIDIIVQTYIESLREADSTKVCFDVKTLKPDFLQDDLEPLEKQAWIDEENAENDQKLRSKVELIRIYYLYHQQSWTPKKIVFFYDFQTLKDEKKQQKAMNSFYEKAAKKNEKRIRLYNYIHF